MPGVTKYTLEIKAQAMAMLIDGQPVKRVARELGVPKGTITYWASKVERNSGNAMAEKERNTLGRLIVDAFQANLETQKAILDNIKTDPEWLQRQSADGVAILYGVLADKSFKIAQGLSGPGAEDVEEAEYVEG